MQAVPEFSIVMPAFNESRDIVATIDAIRAQTVREFEVIVADDGSTDGTPDLVRSIGDEDGRIKLTMTGGLRSAAAARNRAMAAAQGDIVVFVDADVIIPPDFLERLKALYAGGADFVAVESVVADQTSCIGRFQQALHEHTYGGVGDRVGFTQAFSCRRTATQTVAFREALPGCGGEDGQFHDDLVAAGWRGVRAPDIVVRHVQPRRRAELWRQWRGRGRSIPFTSVHVAGRSRPRTYALRGAVIAMGCTSVAAVIPLVATGLLLARHSARPLRDLPGFVGLEGLRRLALARGELAGLRGILSTGSRP